MLHFEGTNKKQDHVPLGTDINEIRSLTTRSSLPTRPTEVLESLLSWRFPSLRYSESLVLGPFLVLGLSYLDPFYGHFLY